LSWSKFLLVRHGTSNELSKAWTLKQRQVFLANFQRSAKGVPRGPRPFVFISIYDYRLLRNAMIWRFSVDVRFIWKR
jgi:hypothetical protein